MVELRGLMINRLIVLLQIIIFPTYFYLWAWLGPYPNSLAGFFFWRESTTSPFGATGDMVILKIVAPLIFALPFTLASLVRANRISNSYELMWRALGKVRIDTKIFYFVNAIFCLFFFILPFGSPIIAVFGAFFAVKLILYTFGVKKNIPALLIVIPGLFLAAIPLMVTIAFYSEFTLVIQPIWETWVQFSPVFYGVVLCLACAIAIGNFFILLREGASQVSYTKEVTDRIGLIIKIALFGGILALFGTVDKWESAGTTMFIINIIAVVLSGFETFIRWRKKLSKETGGGGRIMVLLFIAVNFVVRYVAKPEAAITAIVTVSACVFFVLFILAYRYATDETLFE
ncbi:MAG: hypothetical protein H7645_02625 [Candidatus Heimdallarchaeota archaeon]|nr:hypothetical protein [Candidatus Heimdallarchaeota archaeon]MCK4769210.1 hypothetical protein [Candidatus Heimdallarchaeota archaeon]